MIKKLDQSLDESLRESHVFKNVITEEETSLVEQLGEKNKQIQELDILINDLTNNYHEEKGHTRLLRA
eukprot:CAMPEP_0170550114 /NCGR_PEP_ID=MMETSP0211-20121228/8164_1 /TAXON_ID=311385 /ORGANISM="Pseudokeronopsis sp., Strain OXSARD2" /LENGTH=67 /DNA_ID=CAMNT_0010856449 /DNA_START=566 /DNA_END=769 /DNA_ORIENTATION=+